jgi:hypothetical protein
LTRLTARGWLSGKDYNNDTTTILCSMRTTDNDRSTEGRVYLWQFRALFQKEENATGRKYTD